MTLVMLERAAAPSIDHQKTAADPRLSAFVTANAGSGKTTTLVSRVARLLLAGARPEAVLCVTYTKAAAAEMQRRLFERLGDWAVKPDAALRQALFELDGRAADSFDAESLSRARALFSRALETPGGLKIQTVHAFCEKLLRRFPLEAGVSPNFQVTEDAATAAAIAAEARDAVATLAAAGPGPLAEAFAHLVVALDFAAFERMFAGFQTEREAIGAYLRACEEGRARTPWDVCDVPEGETAADVEREVLDGIDWAAWMAAMEALRLSGSSDQKTAAKMAALTPTTVTFGLLCEIFCTEGGEGKLRDKMCAKGVPWAIATWLTEEQTRVCAARERRRSARVAEDTARVLTLAAVYVAQYEAAKARRGALDFADLVARTRALLTERADAAWVLYKLDGGIDHVLVDEAQDTAPEQWEIVRALTAEFFTGAGAGAGARGAGLERTVFVVGDEKQSIYSFQGAAPEELLAQRQHYERAAREAGAAYVDVPLRESWRSTPEVLAYVDAVFADPALQRSLQPRRDGEDSGIDEVVEHLAKREDGPGTIDLWALEREDEEPERGAWDAPLDEASRGSAYKRLAERIAIEIRRVVADGEAVWDRRLGGWRAADWGDFLILVRKRKALFEETLRALKRAGVPVAGADRLTLSETAAFDDLLALARFCLFPQDDLTLAALLRSPFCEVDEGSLFDLAWGREGNLWATLAWRADERPEWAQARAFLGWARNTAVERPPFDWYGRVLSRLDDAGRSMRARLLRRLGPEAEDAVDEFLAQVQALESRGVRDLETVAASLAELDVTVKREMDEPRGEVRLMTAHGAKGLEAPIVILPETVVASAPRGSPLLKTAEGGFLWCAAKKSDCTASAAARAERERREEDESLRLLYVGLTRARDRLVIAGRAGKPPKSAETLKGWWPWLCAAFEGERLNAAGDPHRVREIEVDGRTLRRYGADPRRASRGVTRAAAGVALPDWARRAAPTETAASWASPSEFAEGAKAPSASPLSARSGLGRFRRGTLIHKLFEVLPDLPPADRTAGAERLLRRERDLDDDQRADIAGAVLAVLDDARFAAVFGPGSRAEAAVAGTAPELGGVAISGRLDRLVVAPDRVLVVDYKTNRPAPDRAEDADPAYLAQMAVYVAVLRTAFPGRAVEAALLWTDGPKLTPLSEGLVAETLAGLRR